MAEATHKAAVSYAVFVVAALLVSPQVVRASPLTRHKRSDDGGPLQAVVENLSSQVTSLTAQLTALNSKVAALEEKAAKGDTAIAFHAMSDVDGFDVLPRGPIVLSHVITRVGTGYDDKTGYFQAPVSGTYFFVATATAKDGTVAWVDILVEGNRLAQVMSNSYSDLNQGTVAASVHLNAGQRVNLANASNEIRHMRGRIYTTFSGLLIHRD